MQINRQFQLYAFFKYIVFISALFSISSNNYYKQQIKRKLLKKEQNFIKQLHRKQINIQRLKKLRKLVIISLKVDFL